VRTFFVLASHAACGDQPDRHGKEGVAGRSPAAGSPGKRLLFTRRDPFVLRDDRACAGRRLRSVDAPDDSGTVRRGLAARRTQVVHHGRGGRVARDLHGAHVAGHRSRPGSHDVPRRDLEPRVRDRAGHRRHGPELCRGHAEVVLDDCRVPASAVIGEVGLGYRYAQVRLGPARLTHCMRWLGVARRALDMRAGRTEPPGMAEEVRPALERLERRAGKRLGDASEPCSCRSARARASRCRGCSTRALRHRPHVEGTPGDKLAVQ
jgi:hypothetical protein